MWFTSSDALGNVLSVDYMKINIDRITVMFTEALKSSGRDFKDIHVPIKKVFMSKDYTTITCRGSQTFVRGDVAVIELAEDVEFSDMVYPACINKNDVLPGMELQYGNGHNVTHDDFDSDELRCHKSKITPCNIFSLANPTPDVICTFGNKESVCPGDSGSGYFYNIEDGRATLVSPLSGGSPPTCHGLLQIQKTKPFYGYAFSTLVSKHLPWICAATGICLDKETIDYYELYKSKGLTDYWYKTFEKLTGTDLFI